MPVQGSVFVSGQQGANQVVLPTVGLTVVGISQIATGNIIIATIPVDSQNSAQFLVGLPTSVAIKAMLPFTMPTTGQVIQVNLSSGVSFAVYYGIPDPESPSINDFIGVYATATITGGGTYTMQFSFPIPGVLTGALLVLGGTATTAYASFTTGIGYTLNILATQGNYEAPLALANLPAPSQLNVTLSVTSTQATSTSTEQAVLILYYSV